MLGFWLFGAEGESSQNWRQVVRDLWERGIREVKLFVSDDLPGIQEVVREIFPSAKWQLCVLHTVRNTLAKVRKVDREALAEDLKAIYRADTLEQAHEALRELEKRWTERYPDLVAGWLQKSYALLEFLNHPKEIRSYLYTTNQLESDGGGEATGEGGGDLLWAWGSREVGILGVGAGEREAPHEKATGLR